MEREDKRRQENIANEERADEQELEKMTMELDVEHGRQGSTESQKEPKCAAKAPNFPLCHKDKDDTDAYLE